MRRRQLALSAALLAAIITIVAPQFSRAQHSATGIYAIVNARIVPVGSAVIDHGTVVIREGLIQAVGANVTPPADARVIDGAGLTVYPGLIDAYTSLGIPAPQVATTAGGPGAAGRGQAATPPVQTNTFASPNSSQPPGLQPEVLASDQIKAGGDQFDAAHGVGITTVLTLPREGIFIGQSALINLAGDTTQEMIVKSPVAMHVGFTPLRTGYPGSLMGVFASLRQMLLDAARYHQAVSVYEKNPRGQRRPEQDKSLEALQPVLTGDMPVVMLANSEREIIRALDLTREFKLKTIIAGGEESWKTVDRLREQNVPVLLSLNFPRRTTAQLPEAEAETMRVLRSRVDAPKTAGKLAAAHVRFGFESGSMTNMDEFLSNVAKAVENGLSRDDAIKALTINSAQILGVDDRLGSIENGKIANLTITRGDIFDRRPRIAYLFIDGQPVDLKPPTPGAGEQRQIAGGAWSLVVSFGAGNSPVGLSLQQDGQNLRGSIDGPYGSYPITDGSLGSNGEIHFSVKMNIPGVGQPLEAVFTGTITNGEMHGTIQSVGHDPGTFTGTRPR